MKEDSLESIKASIKVPAVAGEISVDGFAESYEKFLDENPSKRPCRDSTGAFLCIVGGLVSLLGFSIMLFGSGFTTEGKVATGAGALISLLGMKLHRDSVGVSPEQFLLSEYTLIAQDGEPFYGEIKHLSDDKFMVKY